MDLVHDLNMKNKWRESFKTNLVAELQDLKRLNNSQLTKTQKEITYDFQNLRRTFGHARY